MRAIYRTTLGAFGLALLILCSGHARGAEPNIVFVMADDLGWSDTSNGATNLGNPSDFYETPTLERLATQGMAFTSAYAAQNCAPTRAMLLTGQYATRPTNNVYQVGDLNRGGNSTMLVGPAQGLPTGEDAIPENSITMAETLRTAGYSTAYVGKFHVTQSAGDITSQHGFDHNYGGGTFGTPGTYHASNGVFANQIGPELDAYAANYTQQYVDQNIKPFATGVSTAAMDSLVGENKHVTDAMADAAIDYMNGNNSSPFFLFYSPYAVHTPIGNEQARPDLLAKYQAKTPGAQDSNAAFGALTEGLDQSVARLVNYLETTPDPRNNNQPLSDNTLVVFYSDNGGRQAQSNNGPLKGQKGELDEGGIRVPLITWSTNPNLVDAGTVNSTPVISTDFYTTFASLASATLPSGYTLDGADLSGVIAEDSTNLGRDNLFWHLPGYLVDQRNQRPQSVIRSGDKKLIFNYETSDWELYDLATDISESNNLASTQPNDLQALGSQLLTWLDETNAPLATLRPGEQAIEYTITGQSYANGVITNHNNETFTVTTNNEVPIVLGDVQVRRVDQPVVLPNNLSLSLTAPTNFLTGNEQNDSPAGVLRIAAADLNNSAAEVRTIGQTFRIAEDALVDSITVKAERDMQWDSGSHVLQLAIMQDTNQDGIGDSLVGVVEGYDMANVSIADNSYITLDLSSAVGLTGGEDYHFEIGWASADPTHNFVMTRSGNTNGEYTDGGFINVLDFESFPAGPQLMFNQTRDLTFFINPAAVPEPSAAVLLGIAIGMLAMLRR